MVGPFTTLRASEGHNRAGRGNKFQILTERWQRWHSHTRSFGTPGSITIITEFEIVAKGYKRTLDRKQPVTTPMLLEMRRLLGEADQQDEMIGSELWGPVTVDRSTGTERAHYVRAANLILRDRHRRQVGPEAPWAVSVEMIFDSHKGEQTTQGVTIRHFKPDNSAMCSDSRTSTTKKSCVSNLIKAAAASQGRSRNGYSTHSLRIGGGCALLAAGKSDLVISLIIRWSSWCLTVYARLRPVMIRDAASCMIKASTWEYHEPGVVPS
ncbi:hypothetical protein JG687_00015928 [Phytophthora cactorum]|uniref:Uncharacterized protein n=1 Tax=Phytophthora cactorum TaxID=29920 RepID=A0A8T1TTM1_9STRA|nr:hypothetical protein JG687_00015928 [Phytophthora cactorum]